MKNIKDFERKTNHKINSKEEYCDLKKILNDVVNIAREDVIPVELSIDKGDAYKNPTKVEVIINVITEL